MADEPINLVLEQLRLMRADIAEIKHTLREHGAWLSRLEQGEGLILQMLQRVHDRLDRAEVRLQLRDP